MMANFQGARWNMDIIIYWSKGTQVPHADYQGRVHGLSHDALITSLS